MPRARPEAAFQAGVVELAGLQGWLCYHPPDNVPVTARSGRKYVQNVQAGYPDLTLVRGVRLIFAELKAEKGRVSEAQETWLDCLRRVAVAVNGIAAPARDAVAGLPRDVAESYMVPSIEVYVWHPSDWSTIERVLAR
jgi:hypothetical protein